MEMHTSITEFKKSENEVQRRKPIRKESLSHQESKQQNKKIIIPNDKDHPDLII